MKSFLAIAGTCLLGTARAVHMDNYTPSPGVEAAFFGYLKELYNQTEILDATTSFTDYFVPNTGDLRVLGNDSFGAAAIIREKQMLLPPTGNMRWDHHPNITYVLSDTPLAKTYYVQGIVDKTIIGLNCSGAYYKSRFIVQKTNGKLDLTPHSGNLALYEDFYVVPPNAPDNIPCE